ncbi:MAG: carbamoyltransferase [Nitrospirota bacterium]
MNILGLTDGMTSGASLINDGKIASAVSEERLLRKKMAIGFPWRAISEVLQVSGVDVKDIDGVAISTLSDYFYPNCREWKGWFQEDRGWLREMFLKLSSKAAVFAGSNPYIKRYYYYFKNRLTRNRQKQIIRIFREHYHYKGDIHFIDHHLCHASAAYFTSGINKAIVISMDGGGDGYSSRIYTGIDGRLKEMWSIPAYDSLGNFYAYITHICGFKAHKHEGKITGLAAYGRPVYKKLLKDMIDYNDGTIINKSKSFYLSSLRKIMSELPRNFNKEDLGASIQSIFEDIASDYIEYWVNKTGIRDVVLVGGVFANVKLNQRIKGLKNVDSIYIFPGMGDDGLSVGAAYAFLHNYNHKRDNCLTPYRPMNFFYGRGYTNEEIEKELQRQGIKYDFIEDIETRIARLLADGRVVARFSGRMEFGPRALGNRSILYQTTDKSVNEWLNKRLNRTEFMPFAPVTLEEFADQCYKDLDGGRHAARFMTITFDCTEWMKENCPAVVHIDGTARPQIINKELEPSYYRILDEYRKITGIPSLINTSFNMHEEPIVCSPQDAIRAFQEGSLDYLAIGDFLIKGDE